jgi:hypothetical protein
LPPPPLSPESADDFGKYIFPRTGKFQSDTTILFHICTILFLPIEERREPDVLKKITGCALKK